MTALQMQFAPPYQAPLTEDPMELTSDVDQRAGDGDEIDLDLDLTGDNPLDVEDEFMDEEDVNALADLPSVDGQEIHVVNDDEMADDGNTQGQADEGFSVRDEDIEDAEYTGLEPDEDILVEPDLDPANEQSEEPLGDYENIVGDQDPEQDYQGQERNEEERNKEEHNEEEYNQQEHHELPTTPETEAVIIQRPLPNGQTGLANPGHDVAKLATGEVSDDYGVEVSKEAMVNHGPADQISQPSDVEGLTAPEAKLDQVGEDSLPASLDLEVKARSDVEGSHHKKESAQSSPAHLHPIVLDYQGDEMFLFPPTDQNGDHAATFLLADEQLAYGTIGNLLEACRGVLQGSLGEQDELIISIDDLDLHISESTVECASTRLAEVVDLYVRLQQNDGLENPPPIYMDLSFRNGFSRRLDVLRNGSIEGKGLSQLKSFLEYESDQQHRTESETDPSSHTSVLSTNETFMSDQQPGDEAEKGVDRHDSHSDPLPPEKLPRETVAAPRATQSYPFTDVAQEDNALAETQLGSYNSPHGVGIDDELFSEAPGPKESLEPAQPLAGESEAPEAEGSIVDDGDLIDYEDIEEPEGGTSSASSTLQGDGIDVNAAQDLAVPQEPIIAGNQEHRSPHNVQEDADEEISHAFVDERDTDDVGAPVEEEQAHLVEPFSQNRDDKGQSLSGQSDEEGEAPEDDRDAGPQPEINADDDQHGASAQYEDDAGFDRHETLHEHAQTEGDAHPVAYANINGELEDYSSTHPFQTESRGSGTIFREDDLRRANGLEAGNDPEEAYRSPADVVDGEVPRLSEEVNTETLYVVQDSAQTQEDDDEITYEDEEHDLGFPHEPAKAEQNVTTSPGSLKRPRSVHEDDVGLAEDSQGAKRIRSG